MIKQYKKAARTANSEQMKWLYNDVKKLPEIDSDTEIQEERKRKKRILSGETISKRSKKTSEIETVRPMVPVLPVIVIIIIITKCRRESGSPQKTKFSIALTRIVLSEAAAADYSPTGMTVVPVPATWQFVKSEGPQPTTHNPQFTAHNLSVSHR